MTDDWRERLRAEVEREAGFYIGMGEKPPGEVADVLREVAAGLEGR